MLTQSFKHGVNMTTSLTTFDGFPRADIDVAQIRTTRSRIIYLKNDHKALMQRIESGLHARHAEYQASLSSPNTTSSDPQEQQSSSSQSSQSNASRLEAPFAKINTVAPSSPAEAAGLKPGDRVRRFGDVNWLNHDKLSKLAETVQMNQGRRMVVKVSRARSGQEEAEELELGLVPRSGWGGRGLLGCHILPL